MLNQPHAVRWAGMNTGELLALKTLGHPKARYLIEVDGPLDDPVPTGVLEIVTFSGRRVGVPIGSYVVLDPSGFPYTLSARDFEKSNQEVE